MTETHVLSPPPQPPTRRWLRDTGYALAALPVALAALVVVVALVGAGLGLSVVIGGVFVLVVGVYAARGFAYVERRRLAALTGRAVPEPAYLRAGAGDRFWRRTLTPLRDPQSWLDVVWSLVGWVTGTAAFVVVVTWWATVLGGLSYWLWSWWVPRGDDDTGLAELIGLGDSRRADIGLISAIGLAALVTLPFALRLAAVLHASLASVLLTSRAELQGRVARVEESRESAHRAEAESLRKLERDIHDGPQQRLIRLGMDLGRARVQLADDPENAARTLDAAVAQTREAVEELRALSRGIAPPLLVDRGLAAAVAEMADGQPIPVRVVADVPPELPLAVETAAYFVAAEALTNVVKHSGADRADLTLGVTDGQLHVTVDDNGCGGASAVTGHGLSGLRERLAGVDGQLFLASPAGGPTRLRAEVPLP
ncbi:sensor histidine kinase [Nocardioides humi]|uniref:histidine kinase n=1 Tax=Nocardioides humi TaxID=449461 RepID=A0ABN2B2E8_9ACTN|nr:sensor histidine kinase [Nocardioides humi]